MKPAAENSSGPAAEDGSGQTLSPVLTVEAFQESVIEVWPTALVVSPVGVVGSVVSVVTPPATGVVMSVWMAVAVRAVL